MAKTSLERLRLKKIVTPLFCLLALSLIIAGCGSSGNPGTHTSGLHTRAFVSNSVTSTNAAGLYIVNAQTDVYPLGLAPISAGNTPGMMVVAPNRSLTLVYSGTNTQSSDNQFSVINNQSESNALHFTLPGYTESFVVSPDSATAYIAVPSAPVVGQNPGYIQILSLSSGTLSGQINIPSVHFLAMTNGGSRLLAFTDVPATLYGQGCGNAPAVYAFLITPSEVGISPCPAIPVTGFDRPVQAYFTSDDSTAYVVNCGAECGGTQASVQTFDVGSCTPSLTTCSAGTAVNVPAATEALVDGSTMYLAGTPYVDGVPSQPCTGQTTQATTCGVLTIFDLDTMSIVNPAPIVITDGYHNRMAMAANGQLFIGAHTCTEIIPPQPPPQGAEIRGCLSIYNTLTTQVGSVPAGGVLIPPENGDATGLQPIAQRSVAYVVQGGVLLVYDVTFDGLAYIGTNPDHPGVIFGLNGYFEDVKTVDF